MSFSFLFSVNENTVIYKVHIDKMIVYFVSEEASIIMQDQNKRKIFG